MPSVVELDWGIIFGIFGIAFASFLYGDNFAPESRGIFIMIGYLSLNIGAILFFYHIESLKLRKHKLIYTPFFYFSPFHPYYSLYFLALNPTIYCRYIFSYCIYCNNWLLFNDC